ncbi:hypothetical protein SAMN04488134_11357 [Amphibacillus marinus]|uniref:Uncharacterized protein n=1 Tax=Amphibacillus marinus TaxID=872970 RepID=A0A1H8SNX7_9BACI|nr:hypothetical protein [Amphibacillus marinus]SEO80422.1 hypothetical protein SAMN04488134_11357 [Amphibacillus marinus]
MFEGVSLPFTVADLVESGFELIGLVSTFVLLGLAFMFAPKIIALIRQAFSNRGKA